MDVIIKRGEHIPISQKKYSTTSNNQETMLINIFMKVKKNILNIII